MRENIKISKIDKKETKNYKKKKFLVKNVVCLIYLLAKCLKMKVHEMFECQTNIYVPTFMNILLFQADCK